MLEKEKSKTMRLEGEIADKADAYSRKVTDIEGQANKLKTQSESKQTAQRSEIARLIKVNEEQAKEINVHKNTI
jgi:hypothetical protein